MAEAKQLTKVPAPIMTTAQVSAETGVPVGTLRYWRHTNQGPASFSLGKKKVVYRRTEVERWIAEQETATRRGGISESA